MAAAIGVSAGLEAYAATIIVSVAAFLTLTVLRLVEPLIATPQIRKITLTLVPGVDIKETMAQLEPVLGSIDVTSVESTQDGGHKVSGGGNTRREGNPLEIVDDLLRRPEITAVEFHT